MEAHDPTPEVTLRANELYWGSDRSVNQIAEDLDLSKGALYEAVQPLPAGLGCPLCGTEAVYSNRTAKERGRLDCPACEWSGTVESATLEVEDEGPSVAVTGPYPSESRSGSSDTMRIVAGGALLGAAVGLALVLWVQRRG